MNDALYERLREAGWRRPLTAAEQAELRTWLTAHPEARADWDAEAGLNVTLGRLADAPVPSNFTARVLREIERDTAAAQSRRAKCWPGLTWRHWLPRTAAAVFAVAAVLVSLRIQHASSLAKVGKSLAAVSSVGPAPATEALANFDSIRRLSPEPVADAELLSLLQ
jgi:hypothetical protein